MKPADTSRIGLYGLAVMGQNLALNIADKGFTISVCNRSPGRVDDCVSRAKEEGLDSRLRGFKSMSAFVESLQKPRAVIMLIKAGKPVDQAIDSLMEVLEPGDMIIDGGNEWYENTERRSIKAKSKDILYMGVGVSGGEEGARFGPSLMPGGPIEGYERVADIFVKIAAQVDTGPCVTYIGPGGAGNYVKMVHNGIEYGDMQLIAEAYHLLKHVGGLSNDELADVFTSWNNTELESFLIEITGQIFKKKDTDSASGYLVDVVLDQTGSKGTGKWTCQDAAEQGVAVSTMAAALDARYISSVLEERQQAATLLSGPQRTSDTNKQELIDIVRQSLYASKICSYAQGLKLLQAMSEKQDWNLDLGKIASIWKGGCIIRAVFLDRIKSAYDRDSKLVSLFFDPEFTQELASRQSAWRRVVMLAVEQGIPVPALSGSLAYYDAYRCARLPANLTQAQRDFFGAHTFKRVDKTGTFHAEWANPEA